MDGAAEPRNFAEWRAQRESRSREEKEGRDRRLLQEIRPDFAEPGDAPELEERRLAQRLYALGRAGKAILAATQSGLQIGIAAAYEQLHRSKFVAGEERTLEAVRDAVALEKLPGIALLAAASHYLRAIQTMADPQWDDAEEAEFYGPVLGERLAYFADIREDISGALIHLDSLSRRIMPELPGWLDLIDETLRHPPEDEPERAPDEPTEPPAAIREGSVEELVEQIATQLTRQLVNRNGGEVPQEVTVELAMIPRENLPAFLTGRRSRQEPESDDE